MSHSPVRVETHSFEVPARLVYFIHGLVGRSNQEDSLAEAFRLGIDCVTTRLLYQSSEKVFSDLRATIQILASETIMQVDVSMTSSRRIILRLCAKEYSEQHGLTPNELMTLAFAQYLHGH